MRIVVSRRQVVGGLAAGLAMPVIAHGMPASARAAEPVAINVSSYRFDRTAALFDGRVKISGAKATFTERAIGDMNTAAFSGKGTDEVTEIGLHPFMLAHANDGFRDYALLPVFLLRQFRHKSAFIRTDRGITGPQDLKGRRIGMVGYSSTSLTWIRGIFEDEYGLKPTDVEWVLATGDSSADEAGKASGQERQIPPGVRVVSGPDGLDESELLVRGHVDALFHAATPRAFVNGDQAVARLFPDFRSVEQDYYRRTGIFPIMHVLAIRRSAAEQHPWLARAVFDAYSKAKLAAYRTKDRLTWATDMLPWYSQELENTRALMGRNFYSYGLERNRKTLETLFAYSHKQGLSSRLLRIEDLFLPGSDTFKEPA